MASEPPSRTAEAARRPQRLAFCITDLEPGGAERALVQIVTRLDSRRWEPRVYCLGPEAALAGRLRNAGIPVGCYGARHVWQWGVVHWLAEQLKRERPALLQTFLFHANIVGRIAGRRAGVGVIVSGHRVAEQEKQWHLWVDRATRAWADHHVCVSQGVADHLCRHGRVDGESISVIPNGVDLPGNEPLPPTSLPLPAGVPVLLAAGRLHPQKGFLTLLEAFQRILREVPVALLVIAGEGPQRGELEDRIKELSLEGRVILPGFRDDLPALMRRANLFLLTSRWEGMPNVVLEAMSLGLPVLSAEVEGIAELIDDGVSGVIVNPATPEEFAQRAVRLLQDPEGARRLAESAQVKVSQIFTWDIVARDYSQLYEMLLTRSEEKSNP